jgi:hypothetical protein
MIGKAAQAKGYSNEKDDSYIKKAQGMSFDMIHNSTD